MGPGSNRAQRGIASAVLAAALAVAAVHAGCSSTTTTQPVVPFDAEAATTPSIDASTMPPAAGDAGAGVDAGANADASANADANANADAEADADADPPWDGSLGFDCSHEPVGSSGAPQHLACTGLYENWTSHLLAGDVVPYDPGLHLWSDGATKRRFLRLPPGTTIDTSNMDEWTFPIGTKLWKEFTLPDGTKVETRYLTKRGTSDWVYTTYAWSKDQTTATEVTTGATNVFGSGYEIPTLDDCRVCHMGRIDYVLGVEAIALSSPQASGLTMNDLVARGWITNAPSAPLVVPGNATESAALSWLHVNCGEACHNRSPYSLAGSTGFFMRLTTAKLGSVQETDTWTTGVNVAASFKQADGGALMRIAPHDPSRSCVIYRDSYRDTQGEGIQMPPIDTHVVDTAGVQAVTSWINAMP